MPSLDDIVKKWLEDRNAEQRIIDGTASDHEILGAIAGVPPQAIALIEQTRRNAVLEAKISRWWQSIPPKDQPPYVTMHQFKALFGGKGIGAWQIGVALRSLGWRSSRRSWVEHRPRCRLWLPPESEGARHVPRRESCN